MEGNNPPRGTSGFPLRPGLGAIPTLLLGATVLLSACSDRASAKKPQAAASAVPVTVSTVVEKTVPLQVRAVGNVEAYSTVSIKPQVSGELVRVHFREGQEVKKGDLLFTIDARPFQAALSQAEGTLARDQAQLRQAEANLARDEAQLETARVQERRYRELVEKEFVAREQYDQVRTTAVAMEATVQADRAAVENARAAIRTDQAAVDNARLQLGYTSIRSPMDGRTGNLLEHAGNVVKANPDTPLVVINQVHPIYVTFAVPEQYLAEIKKFRAAGTLRVDTVVPTQEAAPGQGELTFVNNTVDVATGTIQLKATFPNTDNRLWPGQFVNVILTLASEPNQVTIPSQALQTGQQGTYVFVVKPDLTVDSRSVLVGRTLDGETTIQKGLAPGERVVTDGQLRLVPGTKVEIKTSTPPAPAGRLPG